jgi:hypothetical protein
MNDSPPADEGEPRDDSNGTDRSLSVATLLAEARRRIQTNPAVIVALLVAGIVVAGVDWACLHDAIPTVGFNGIQEGNLAVSFGVVVRVFSRATTPLSALVGLKLRWLAWIVGLELLGVVAAAGVGASALARLLEIRLRVSALLRYAGIVALLQFGPEIHFEEASILVVVVLFPVTFALLVRLFALPGFVVAGYPVISALRQSWKLTRGYGWSLFGIILLVGLLNHLLTSVPVVGPIGSALVGALHAGTVAAFLHQSEAQVGAIYS